MKQDETTIYQAYLRREVERTLGYALCGPSDFERAAEAIEAGVGERLSVSSLKRLWGYVEWDHHARRWSLELLSRFVGQTGFDAFCELADRVLIPESHFLRGELLTVKDINVGNRLRLRWEPGRCIEVTCIATGRFRVDRSENAKLREGMEFSARMFGKGFPLQAYSVTPPSVTGMTVYVAVPRRGLTEVSMI